MTTTVMEIGEARVPLSFGSAEEVLENLVRSMDVDRVVLVMDEQVRALYSQSMVERLRRVTPVLEHGHRPGEGQKSLHTIAALAEATLQWGATRRTLVVGLGGGVTGNMAGLLAALLFRGIRLVQVPTTLIGMLDSVVSLKQAVNSTAGKNHIGVFYAPTHVVIDAGYLQTLPAREMRGGVCEVLKTGLAVAPSILDAVRPELQRDGCYDIDALRLMVASTIDAKLELLRADPFERQTGLAFEYGHTIGHAVELVDYRVRDAAALGHGEAVGLGMLAAAYISQRLTGLGTDAAVLHHELLSESGAATTLPSEISVADVTKLVRFDNKRGYSPVDPGYADMVLLAHVGQPAGPADRPLLRVPIDLIEEAVASLVA